MKTIFITAFQAVEVKNLLRTGVVGGLLKDPDVRVVLFMKNQVRVDHYKKEFNDPRIIYEVADQRNVGALNLFFSKLKFTLLRTDTTVLRRKLFFEHRKNYFHYYSASLINWVLARPFIRRSVRALDYSLVSNNFYTPCFEKYKPDLVFLAHLFEDSETQLLRVARAHGVKTVGFINSWDKVTARSVLRLLPDKLLVFNDIVKREVVEHNEMKPKDVFVCGIPQYDYYFSPKVSGRKDFFRRIGVDSQKKLIVFIPAGTACSDSDWEAIDLLYRSERDGRFGSGTAILVRFPPNDFLDETEIKKRASYLICDNPGIRFAQKRGGDWDMAADDLKHLKDTLYHMDLVISYGASSFSVDAAIFDKPIIHLNFDMLKNPVPYKSPPRFYEMEHAKKAFFGGGVRRVNNADELAFWVRRYLEDPAVDRAARRQLAETQCKFLDGKSSERIASFVLKQT